MLDALRGSEPKRQGREAKATLRSHLADLSCGAEMKQRVGSDGPGSFQEARPEDQNGPDPFYGA